MTDSIVCVSHTGEVRLPLFERLCDLDRIDFKGNPDIDTTTLVGWLTCNMETLNNLSELDASGIGVTGFIPRCLLLKQSNLRNVNLSSNRLTGPTVSEVIKLLSPCASSLERLNLSCNKLGGALPEKGMWEFIELRGLDLTNTGVSGPISKDLEHLTALQFIALSRNSFEGGVSEAFFGLLRRLDRFEMCGVISPTSVLDSVACNSTRLDNITRINASSQELRGMFGLPPVKNLLNVSLSTDCAARGDPFGDRRIVIIAVLGPLEQQSRGCYSKFSRKIIVLTTIVFKFQCLERCVAADAPTILPCRRT